MNISDLAKFRNWIVLALIVIFSGIALWIRMLPADGLFTAVTADLLGNDPWYMLREIEAMCANSLQYPWFDPMTQYPYGTDNFWGPLYPMLAAIMCFIAGASARYDIMYVSCLLPALMGALMVPLMYFVGQKLGDWKTGIISAIFVAVISGQYFYRSLFGFVDHHIAETFFAVLFALFYIWYIAYTKEHKVDFKDKESLKIPALIAAFAGIAYVLGVANMPTMVLLALIAAIYTGIQFIINRIKSETSENLVLLNVTTFAIAILGFLIIGIHHAGISMLRYSWGHPLAYAALIIATLLLFALENALNDKPHTYYFGGLIAIGIAGFVAITIFVPTFLAELNGFFGYTATLLTIQEAKNWSFEGAWSSFHFGLILMALGLIICLYKIIKETKWQYLFVLIWSLMMIYATTIQVRYEYYLAANIALLGGIAVAWAIDFGWKDLLKLTRLDSKLSPKKTEEIEVTAAASEAEKTISEKKVKGQRSKSVKNTAKTAESLQKSKKSAGSVNLLAAGILIAVVLISIPFVWYSTNADIQLGNAQKGGGMTPDWRESLEWMGENTVDTGIDYYKIYTRDSYVNPESAYGVMSWWDYGHWITFISKRAPNANPFQEGVAGPNGAAAYFIQQDESASNKILDNLDTRYVITDIEMDISKFWAMTTWYDSAKQTSPYTQYFAIVNPDNSVTSTQLNSAGYYQTMISKLHNSDGSMTEPTDVYYIEYVSGSLYGITLPIIANAELLPYADAKAKVDAYNVNAKADTGAGLFSSSYLTPVEEVPALQHYRLVHESPTNTMGSIGADLKYVKIFEYVPGAHIKGEGVIEIDLKTDQGRSFTYAQRSVDGEFIVPYSTTGNNKGTEVLSNYRIRGTEEKFDVSEDAVLNGLTIN